MRPGMAPAAAAAPSRASVLGGALQTAAGVAGGMLVADLLTGMFRHSQPQEIVEVIQDVPVDNLDASQFADPEPAPSASPIATIPPTAVSPMAISATVTSTTTPASATTICSPDR